MPEMSDFAQKVLEGLRLAFERLVDRTIKEGGYLVFSENGKIVKVQAADLKKYCSLSSTKHSRKEGFPQIKAEIH